jgi:hypothetical protein
MLNQKQENSIYFCTGETLQGVQCTAPRKEGRIALAEQGGLAVRQNKVTYLYSFLCISTLHNVFFSFKSSRVEQTTPIKKKIKFSSYIRKFRVEQLQSHIWGRAGFLYMRKCENISPYMKRPLVIYDFATAPFWITLYMRKIWFSFYQWRKQLLRFQKSHNKQLFLKICPGISYGS